jgi:hypothetical protein
MTVFQNFQTVFRIQEILYGQGLGSLYLLVSGRQLQSVLPGSTAVLPPEIAIEVFRIGKTVILMFAFGKMSVHGSAAVLKNTG